MVQHFRDEPDAAVDRGTPAQTFARTLRVCVYSADTADGIDLETVDRESSCPAIEYHSATEHLRTAWGNPSLACDYLRLLGQEEVWDLKMGPKKRIKIEKVCPQRPRAWESTNSS